MKCSPLRSLTIFVGLAIVAAVEVLIDPKKVNSYTEKYGSLATLFTVIAVAIPLQTCEHAATSVAVALKSAGVSTDTALAFLLCCPAASATTQGKMREIGKENGGQSVEIDGNR